MLVRAGSENDDLAPYEETAAGLDDAVLAAQIARLNPVDRELVRARLKLVTRTEVAPLDPAATDKAMAKLRHPSVARVWKLRAVEPGRAPEAG